MNQYINKTHAINETEYLSEINSSKLAIISKILKSKDINKLEELRTILIELSKLSNECNENSFNSLNLLKENIKSL